MKIKILIAPDSFKESLTALEVAENLEKGLKTANSNYTIRKVPMADGGEGTVKSLVDAENGKIIKKIVTGPAGDKTKAFYGILGAKKRENKTAVIEMAAASGLDLLPEEKRNPAKTTSYGTGELIKGALDNNCSKLIIGLGGSATNDCGVGMIQALGGRFLDKNGQNIDFGGENLINIAEIDISQLDPRLKNLEIAAACDVDNPLYGKNGAAYIYGAQKGATAEQIKELDQGLKHISKIIKRDLKKDIAHQAGAGAAGGLGAALLAFLEADLRPGIEIVIEAVKLKEKMWDIDLVITGEGKLDDQSLAGKTPVGVAKLAKKYNIPVIAVVGTIGQDADKVYEVGIDAFFSIIDSPLELKKAIQKSPELLFKTGINIGRLISILSKIKL